MNKQFAFLTALLLTVVLMANSAHGQTLYSETFTATNGTTVGTGNPAKWTRDLNGRTPTTYSVQSNVMSVNNTGGEVIWNSQVIPIQSWATVNLSVSLSATANMEAGDYLNVYYKLNGGAETQFTTNGANTGTYGARTASHNGLSGTTLQIVVRMSSNAANETHAFDNVTATGVVSTLYSENFTSYSNGTTTSSLWTLTGSGTILSVQSGQFQAQNVSTQGNWQSSVIDISAYKNINLSVGLSEPNGLEGTDYIRVYYKLNGGTETLFSVNGDKTDDFTSATATQSITSGSTLQIVIRFRNDASENYYWDNVTITGNPAGSTMSLTTTPTDVTGCEGSTNGSIALSVSNGCPPFTYAWSTTATTQNISSLGTGTYTVTVTDYNGTTATKSQAVAHPNMLNVSVSKTNPTNNNNRDGSIGLTITGGTTPYSIAWNIGETTEDLDSLYSGAYTWLVTDAAGCSYTDMEILTYNDTLPVGSFIINMGVSPQTIANGLKPYGLIYQLIRNYKVPVSWSINPSKVKDAKDFTYNGTDYKGGTFVIYEGFITNSVKSLITAWQAKGVVGVYTTTPVVIPIYQRVSGFANVVVDEDNESLVTPYFTNAEVPDSIYTVGLPSDLGACHDFFILPHADPTWALHGNLYTFNTTRKGHIWTGCHATSMLEGLVNPSDTTQKMNFLTRTGLQCYSEDECGAITEEHAGTATSPFTYSSEYDVHPIMQLMGDMTPSQENGSEEWYIPVSTGGWNANVARAITTSDGSAGKEGVKLAFGYGYNNPLNGIVMYQGGHTAHNKGTVASQVAAERAFFNFILHASIEKYLSSKGQVPSTFINLQGQTVSVEATGGNPPYTYSWTSSAPGTFSDPDSNVTTFTPTGGQADRSYYLTCTVTDACGRINYISAPIEFLDVSGVVTDVSCYNGSNGAINVTVSGGTLPITYAWSNGATTEDLTGLPAGDYEVVVTDSNGYSQNATFTVTQPTEIAKTESITNTTYACSSDGAINITPSGATPPYTFSWSNGGSSEDKTGLAKGNYTVTISDSRSCQKSFTMTVSGPANLALSFTPTNVNTYDATNGSIDATVTGGTAPYAYAWCNTEVTQDITNKKAGPYSLTVTDVGGCTVSGSSVIGVTNAYTFKGLREGEVTEVTWNSSNNWDAGQIPTNSNNVVIPAGCAATVTVPVNSNTKDLFIAEGASVVVQNGKDIQISGDFILNGTFTPGTGNVLFNGSVQQHIITSQVAQFYKLTMNNTSSTGLFIDTNIVVQNQLVLNDGNIYTDTDTIKITNAAESGVGTHSENSYVVGYLQRNIVNSGTNTYDFPLGYGAPNQYFKASIIAKALKTTANITGSVMPLERSTGQLYQDIRDSALAYHWLFPEAMWTLEPNVQPTGGTYDVKLWTVNIPMLMDNYFGIVKRPVGTTDESWIADFGYPNRLNGEGRLIEHGYAMKKAASTFSEFGIGGGGSNPLPIQLLSFDARLRDGKTHLEWYTATEINNDFFTIERIKSMNDVPVEIARVKGAGNSSEMKSYTAVDEKPLDGISYYRLKQTDYDGKFTYSNWVAIENKTKTSFSFGLRPNPADTYTNLDFKNVGGELSVVIFDASSKVVYTKSFSENNKPESHQIIFSDVLSKGTYIVKVLVNKEVHIQRLVVQ